MTDGGLAGNDADCGVVEEICGYLTAESPRSFFLFAGAGSGKTRTLVDVLKRLTGRVDWHAAGMAFATRLRARGQSIRVITYTKIAAAEVAHRLGSNTLTRVSTIHSFAWDLIEGFNDDIREALIEKARADLHEMIVKADARKRGRTSKDGEKIAKLEARIERLRVTTRFTYTPDRTTYGDGALQHADVLSVLAILLRSRGTLAQILADRHPVLLIDESQDTMVSVLDALKGTAEAPSSGLSMGLLGDHRQRIYMDGHRDLPSVIPAGWARPVLRMNHRSQGRIVTLINTIWATQVDGRTQPASGEPQQARVEKREGVARIFVGDGSATANKAGVEHQCAAQMVEFTASAAWLDHDRGYRLLALEHKLAAYRGGFLGVWTALRSIDENGVKEKGDAPDGSDAGPAAIRVLMREVAALAGCVVNGSLQELAAIEVMRRFKRLEVLNVPAEAQPARLAHLAAGVRATAHMLATANATIREVSTVIASYDLFELSPKLQDALDDRPISEDEDEDEDEDEAKQAGRARAWQDFLDAPWSELVQYRKYLADRLPFGTHQGVKGAEYDHVMVILDDDETRTPGVSYDKLLGVTPLTDTDRTNKREGKETTIDRTLRLLYVTCSRPKESLAIVHWSTDPDAAVRRIEELGWFKAEEVIRL